MSGDSADQIDPWRACQRSLCLSGQATLEQMPRLASAILGLGRQSPVGGAQAPSESAGTADYELRFQRDPQGRPIVVGRVSAILRLRCQRCLEEVEQAVEADIQLALIEHEDATGDLPEHLDPWLVNTGRVAPLEMVEDELLLAVPLTPRHEPGACQAVPSGVDPWEGDPDEASEPARPFAALAALKKATRH